MTAAQIDIQPDQEALERLVERYRGQEQQFPAVPEEPKGPRYWLIVLVFIITSIPALLLVLLRIPFILLRRIRLWLLKKLGEAHFKENYAWDPDHAGSEYSFEEPAYKEPVDARYEKLRQEQRQTTETLRQDWLKDPEKLAFLMDYASCQSIEHRGKERNLYILDQLLHLVPHASLNESMLLWNMGVVLGGLGLPNQSKHYRDLALEKGFEAEEPGYRSVFTPSPLLTEAWHRLYRDVINCWPSAKASGSQRYRY